MTTLEAAKITPLDEIYKNAFNLIIGGQGQGKTYHAEEIIAKNRHHFPVIKRFSPVGTSSIQETDGDLTAKVVAEGSVDCMSAQSGSRNASGGSATRMPPAYCCAPSARGVRSC